MIKANTTKKMCTRCNVLPSVHSSLFCANCNDSVKCKETTLCKIGECTAEAINDGLCAAHFSGSTSTPKATVSVVKPAPRWNFNSLNQLKSDYQETTLTKYTHCKECGKNIRGGKNGLYTLIGLCYLHQKKEEEQPRRCAWEKQHCPRRPKDYWHFYCSRHDKEKMKKNNEASKRSQTKPAIRNIDSVNDEWMKQNVDLDDDVF